MLEHARYATGMSADMYDLASISNMKRWTGTWTKRDEEYLEAVITYDIPYTSNSARSCLITIPSSNAKHDDGFWSLCSVRCQSEPANIATRE